MKIARSLLLTFAVTGCAVHWHHYSNSYQSNFSASYGGNWTDEQQLVLEYHIRDDGAALETKPVVLVFDGITADRQRIFHFQGRQQVIQIEGPGTSSVSVTCANSHEKIAFHSRYSGGTNTVEFDQQSVQFVHGARLLLVGDQTIELGKDQKTVHLRDGKLLSAE